VCDIPADSDYLFPRLPLATKTVTAHLDNCRQQNARQVIDISNGAKLIPLARVNLAELILDLFVLGTVDGNSGCNRKNALINFEVFH